MLLLFKRSLSSSARYMRTIFHSSELFSLAQLVSLEQRPAGGPPAAAPARAQAAARTHGAGGSGGESPSVAVDPTLHAWGFHGHFLCSWSHPHGDCKDAGALARLQKGVEATGSDGAVAGAAGDRQGGKRWPPCTEHLACSGSLPALYCSGFFKVCHHP